MVDPTDKDTKHIKDQSMGAEGYLEYTKENEKGKVNQLDVGNKKGAEKFLAKITFLTPVILPWPWTRSKVIPVYQGRVKTARTKLDDQYKVS